MPIFWGESHGDLLASLPFSVSLALLLSGLKMCLEFQGAQTLKIRGLDTRKMFFFFVSNLF